MQLQYEALKEYLISNALREAVSSLYKEATANGFPGWLTCIGMSKENNIEVIRIYHKEGVLQRLLVSRFINTRCPHHCYQGFKVIEEPMVIAPLGGNIE